LLRVLNGARSLAFLGLFDNQIGDLGCTELANLLSDSTSITCLDINQNNITFNGAAALAQGKKEQRVKEEKKGRK